MKKEDKIKLLYEFQQGKISIHEIQKVLTTKKVILSSFIDWMRYTSNLDENGKDELMEIEIPPSDFNKFLTSLIQKDIISTHEAI